VLEDRDAVVLVELIELAGLRPGEPALGVGLGDELEGVAVAAPRASM